MKYINSKIKKSILKDLEIWIETVEDDEMSLEELSEIITDNIQRNILDKKRSKERALKRENNRLKQRIQDMPKKKSNSEEIFCSNPGVENYEYLM